jgi:hypothetical protein
MVTWLAATWRWSLYNKIYIHETKFHKLVSLINVMIMIDARNMEHIKFLESFAFKLVLRRNSTSQQIYLDPHPPCA